MNDSERAEWIKSVPPVRIALEGTSSPLFLAPKVFKTGSVGWFYSGKVVLSDSACQVNLCITVIGTKTAPTSPVPSVNGSAPAHQDEPETPQGLFDLRTASTPPNDLGTRPEPTQEPKKGRKRRGE